MFLNVDNKQHIEINQFDYVVANIFPVHNEVFYLLLKLAITCAFLYISLSTFLLLDDTVTRKDWELISTSSFVFILISPAVVGYIFLSPVDKRVASYSEQIKELMKIWKDNIQGQTESGYKHVLCDSHSRLSRLRIDYLFCCCVLLWCGCLADIDNKLHCYVCSFFKAKDFKSSDVEEQVIYRGDEMELHQVYIQFPNDDLMVPLFISNHPLFTIFCKNEGVESDRQGNTDEEHVGQTRV